MVSPAPPLPSTPAFFIRSIPIHGDLILSPMDGFSDLPFRSLCRELGSAISYTEFVNCLNLIPPGGKPKRTLPAHIFEKLAFLPGERPVAFQIFDSDPDRMLEAALRLQELRPDFIDINMGCSVSSVSGRGAGAGLLRSPLKIARIFKKLSHTLDVPVTGKIRLGWDENARNYMLVARVIEENGGALVAVHGRTKSQGYGGNADWDAITEVKQAVSIPVLGNGDVRSAADIEQIKAYTGCDGVLIGRGAVGNPWIFSRLDRMQVSPREVQRTMLRHLDRMLTFYGQDRGLILFRKHASRYISPFPLSKEQRQRLLTAERPEQFQDFLEFLANLRFTAKL
jgi:nifR3 family TIM-barrel protein